MKQLPHALDLRSYLFQQLEEATLLTDKERISELLTFIVVGGGPTGVELAGALAELKKHVLPSDYRTLDLSLMKIYLVEGLGSLLPAMSDKAGQTTKKYLEKLGVVVQTGKLIQSYDGRNVTFNTGESMVSETVIWAAGVQGNPIEGIPQEGMAKGRIIVNKFNQIKLVENKFHNSIYALGDVAAMVTDKNPKGHPMLAPVAIQQGQLLAKNIHRVINKKPLKPFKYTDKGALATVGRNKAIGDLPRVFIKGFLGWIIWLFVHLMYLVGFRNKLVVVTNWIWNYFSYDRGIRLIVRPYIKPNDPITKKLAEENQQK